MIPLTLVTGFLGSGKTTLLRHIAKTTGQRLVFLVNEFSSVDVDGPLVEQAADDVISIPGGSIFCRCLVSEFISALSEVPDCFPGTEGVVIEASGVANPMVIEQMLQETKLDEVYSLSAIICTVNPRTFPTLKQTLPSVTAQVVASDLVIINKTDLFCDEEIAATEASVREINPNANTVKAVRCEVDLPIGNEHRARFLRGDYALCTDPNYARLVIELDHDLDLVALVRFTDALGTDLYRLKGFAQYDGAQHWVEVTDSGLAVSKANGASAKRAEIAVIVGGEARERAEALARKEGLID